MRGVVSDLNIRLGATREWLSYRWGVALSGNVYRQRNDVKFYNFDGGYSQYLMTGLGENYHRFADNKPDVQYRGGGVGISLQMMPATSQGWLASVSTSEHRYERILVSYNSLPLTTLYHQQIDLMVGWKREGDSDFAIWGEYRWNKRSSDESIVGASSVNVYPVEVRSRCISTISPMLPFMLFMVVTVAIRGIWVLMRAIRIDILLMLIPSAR